jgi:hypothetical protein
MKSASPEDGTITLAVESIEGMLTQPIRINVFVNKPDANSKTSVEDTHFIGYISMFPRLGGVKGVSRAFDLSSMEAVDPTAPLRVTLVPVTGIDLTPRDAALRVGRIYVRREN